MTDAGFFRGTSVDQDNRFANKQKKLLKGLNFSPILNTKLNMSKIDLVSLKPWIETKIKDVLEKEDELLSESIYEHLKEKEPDGKNILVLITGFVDEVKASKFMEELWTKLIDLQDNSNGTNKTTSANQSSDLKPKDNIAEETTTATTSTTTSTSAKPDDRNEVTDDPTDGDSKIAKERHERETSRSSKSSHSMTPPSRSVSKSPGSHRLHDRSRGRQRRRPLDDELSREGSEKPALEGKKSRSRTPSGSRSPSVARKSPGKSGDDARRRSRSRSSSRSRRSGSRSISRSRSRTRSRSRSRSKSGSRSRSYSKSRSLSRSPRNRSRSPYSHSYRGRRSRSRSRGFAPRSRSPRGRRFWPNSSRGSYRGHPHHHTSYGGFHERRRGAMGSMRRRSPWGRRRYSPRSPPRRRRSPSFSPRRRRSPSSPYQRRSRSRTPPIHVTSGRGVPTPRSHGPEHLDMLRGRHVPIHHDMHRSMPPANRSPRGHLNHRTYAEGQLLPRHSPGLVPSKAPLDLPSASQGSLLNPSGQAPTSPDRYSPLSSSRKKHKKDKKHRKHKKSKKHRSESPEKKKKHKKHKKTKKHKSH